MIQTNDALLTYFLKLYESGVHNAHIQLKTFPRDSFLITQGGFPKYIFLVLEGFVKCFIDEENGRTYLIEFFGEGQILGELEILSKTNYFTNIQSITNTKALRMDASLFKQIIEQNNNVKDLIMNDLVVRLVELAKKSSFQQVYSVEHSIIKILDIFHKNKEIITKTDLAAYLGITLRTLNRSLKDLEIEGFGN